jgi:hypothetical protein
MVTNEKAGAWALILGALSYIALMAVHPSHSDGGAIVGPLTLNAIVHGTALAMNPVLLFGFWQLSDWIGARALARVALCFYALGAVLVVLAGSMSGLVIPEIISVAHHAPGALIPGPVDPHTLQPLANYSVWLNRIFAGVHAVYFAVAMLLWSIAWSRNGALSWIVRSVGVLVGLGIIAWAVSGTMTLEAQHGALLVTVVQMLWTLLAAAAMLTGQKAVASAD